MRWIDYRRHARRNPGAVHLNPEGLAIARRVGAESGPFVRSVTSTVPRAIETAEAMGFPPTETLGELATLGRGVEAALGPVVTWADAAAAVRRSAAAARYAKAQGSLLREIALGLPDGGRALVISHGGVLEIGAVGALPKANHQAWGGPAGYCEGIRLAFDRGRFTDGVPLRVAPGR